ncbi:histone [Delftia sp. GW456-R20]|uniref:H-NS histone family protein n=1 Tax=Delftia sp. GW456-R20 TaxID=1827145 RepID=UPI0007B48A38|nr:H-NS histone family protein [Delftia sp. GW456-R20]KZK32397.1 histone [Delftia sp. GW456-R20]
MATYKELLAQRAQLESKIADARKSELATAVASVRELISQYNLTAEDIFPAQRGRRQASQASPSVARYRDPSTGATWTGRGKPPNWIKDKDRTKYEIQGNLAI